MKVTKTATTPAPTFTALPNTHLQRGRPPNGRDAHSTGRWATTFTPTAIEFRWR